MRRTTTLLPDIAVALVALASFVLSWKQAASSLDPYHWGLMLSSALDLMNGRLPYRDILVPYGIATTLVHALGLKLFGATLLNLGLATAAFYSTSLVLLYAIWLQFLSRQLAAVAVVAVFLIHPVIIYPWPNYIAYTFLLAGLYLYIESRFSSATFSTCGLLLAGLLLALSILARDSNAPFVALAIGAIALLDLARDPREALYKNSILVAGVLFGLIVFAAYLMSIGEFGGWIHYNLALSRYYLLRDSPVPLALARWLWRGLNPFQVGSQRFIYSYLFLSNVVLLGTFCYSYFRNRSEFRSHFASIVCAVFALAGFGSALHLPEVFRLQNAASIGFGSLLYLMNGNIGPRTIRDTLARRNVGGLVVAFTIGATLFVSLYTPGDTNIVPFPRQPPEVPAWAPVPRIFEGQKWESHWFVLYSDVSAALEELKLIADAGQCHLVGIENDSGDAFYTVLSPFRTLHKMPSFGSWYGFDASVIDLAIEPDYAKRSRALRDSGEMLILQESTKEVPHGYSIFREFPIPWGRAFLPSGTLYILAPTKCIQRQ